MQSMHNDNTRAVLVCCCFSNILSVSVSLISFFKASHTWRQSKVLSSTSCETFLVCLPACLGFFLFFVRACSFVLCAFAACLRALPFCCASIGSVKNSEQIYACVCVCLCVCDGTRCTSTWNTCHFIFFFFFCLAHICHSASASVCHHPCSTKVYICYVTGNRSLLLICSNLLWHAIVPTPQLKGPGLFQEHKWESMMRRKKKKKTINKKKKNKSEVYY